MSLMGSHQMSFTVPGGVLLVNWDSSSCIREGCYLVSGLRGLMIHSTPTNRFGMSLSTPPRTGGERGSPARRRRKPW